MLIINEWRFCLRQPLVLLSMILIPLLAYILTDGIVEGSYSPTNELQLTLVTLLMLLLPIALGALSPSVFLRDNTANMTELINSTPISHNKRWLLRYSVVASLLIVLFILSFSVVLVTYSVELGFQIELLTLTLLNLLLLVLPSILIATAFALWLSSFGQSAMVMYACIAAAGISYLMLASMAGSPVLSGTSVVNDTFYHVMLWLDPYGISALLDNINSANTYVSKEFVGNRLFYLLLSVVFVYFVLKKNTKPASNQKRHNSVDTTKKYQGSSIGNKITSRIPSYSSCFVQLIKVPFFMLIRSRITQIIFGIWPMFIFNEVFSGIDYAEPLSVLSPNSIDALNLVAFDIFSVSGAFVVALWSWFICTQDKSYNFAELVAASPILNRQLVCAQIITLGLLIVILLLLTFVGSSLAELMAGSDWLFYHYLVQLSLSGLPLFLLSTIFICIYHLCRSSVTAGGIVALIILIKFTPIMTSLGLTHTLWNIADSPLQAPDNFWGYSASASLYLPYMSVWVAACIFLTLLASSRSHRGTCLDKLSLNGLPKCVYFFFVVTMMAGLSLHFALVSEKPLTNSDKREAWQAQYEKNYGDWQHKPQPSVVHIDSEIDIYPKQQFANFKLSYTLENQTTMPIAEVLIGRYGNYAFGNIALDGATLVELDTDINQGIYQFSKILMPGEQRIMHAEFSFNQPQYWPHRSHQVVKSEFAYFRANPLLPTVGYQGEYQLKNTQTRAKYHLKEIENVAPSALFKDETVGAGTYQWASLSTLISTNKGHHAISQGNLISSWHQGQRSFFKFQTKKPIRAIPAWLSVPYSALSQNSQGVILNVYTPYINEAAKINLTAMSDTLAWFAKHITPYTGAQLNLVSVPDIGSNGYSLPQITLIKNTVGFRAAPAVKAGFDQRYRRAVHETAHQWFGHDLGNGVQEDRAFLVESVVKYIELAIIEQHYGKEAMLALVAFEKKRLQLSQRNNVQTLGALVNATQEHDIHSRATLVFAELRETIGDNNIIEAFKSLWLQHAYPKKPATSMDFVRALKRHSATTHHSLINELFLNNPKRVTIDN